MCVKATEEKREKRTAKWRNEYLRSREIIGMCVNGGNNT